MFLPPLVFPVRARDDALRITSRSVEAATLANDKAVASKTIPHLDPGDTINEIPEYP